MVEHPTTEIVSVPFDLGSGRRDSGSPPYNGCMTATVAQALTFEQKLDQLARVAIEVGLGLNSGQELVMTAPLEAVPLARRITEQAYRAGASLVTTLYTDDEAALMRYRFAPDAAFDRAAGWLYDGMGFAFKSGAARLAITGANPLLLSNEDPAKVGRANRAVSKAYRPALELITRHEINWTIVASATPAWAAAMFPDATPSNAMDQLWEAILATSRINVDDPVANWKAHDAELHRRASFMNEKRYAALQYRGPGTAWPTTTSGWAAAPPREMGAIAFPTCPRRKSSPRPTRTALRERLRPPSRSRTRER